MISYQSVICHKLRIENDQSAICPECVELDVESFRLNVENAGCVALRLIPIHRNFSFSILSHTSIFSPASAFRLFLLPGPLMGKDMTSMMMMMGMMMMIARRSTFVRLCTSQWSETHWSVVVHLSLPYLLVMIINILVMIINTLVMIINTAQR